MASSFLVQNHISSLIPPQKIHSKDRERQSAEISSSLLIQFKEDMSQLKSDVTETIMQRFHDVFDVFREEMKSIMNAEELATKQALFTSVEQPDPKQVIDQLVHQRQFEEAFKRALSSGDLTLVTRVCSLVDPKDIFSSGNEEEDQQENLLSQPVIISLIQQLTHNLTDSEEGDLKLQWIYDALLALNMRSPDIADYLPHTLCEVTQSLSSAITSPKMTLSPLQIRQYKRVLNLAKAFQRIPL
jgi:hypothetical protein